MVEYLQHLYIPHQSPQFSNCPLVLVLRYLEYVQTDDQLWENVPYDFVLAVELEMVVVVHLDGTKVVVILLVHRRYDSMLVGPMSVVFGSLLTAQPSG